MSLTSQHVSSIIAVEGRVSCEYMHVNDVQGSHSVCLSHWRSAFRVRTHARTNMQEETVYVPAASSHYVTNVDPNVKIAFEGV
jgi:hypothetical protein